MSQKHFIKNLPLIGKLILFCYRCWIGSKALMHPIKSLFFWLIQSRETSNFTYHLTAPNKRYLISLIAEITGKPYQEILGYILELETNQELQEHVRTLTLKSKASISADLEARYGRRLGWYAIVRAIKPKVVVETGVDKGLGSCVITAALIRNEQENCPGYYYGTDINPEAGYLFCDRYRQYGEILYGDSIASLESLDATVDLFINDSDHSASYEEKEYQTVVNKLSSHAILLGDNAHVTDKLLDFALATNRQFIFFQEKPDHHWYPGAGIGIAFRR